MKTKLFRPVLVESKSKSTPIGKYKDSGLLVYNDHVSDIDRGVPMDLILISLDHNEKIEVGDKVYFGEYIIIVEKLHSDAITFINPFDLKFHTIAGIDRFKKVIATQDQLSPEYIQQFVEEYNKGKVKDVEIGMENYSRFANVGIPPRKSLCSFPNEFRPKLTNGFVTIVEKKSITYTEKEVYELTKEAVGLWRKSLHTTKLYRNKEHHGKWWNEIKKK